MSIQALREQIAALAKEVRALVEGKKDQQWTAQDQAKYDESMTAIEAKKGELKRAEAVLDLVKDETLNNQIIETAGKNLRDTKSIGNELYNKWLRGGDAAITSEEWAHIRATMSTTTPSEGGYAVPASVAEKLIDSLKAFGGMREVATILKTTSGNDLSFPTTDGTAEVGELIAQNTTATGADPTFGTVALPTYKFSSKIVAVPYELLQDAVVDVEALVRQRCATRVFRATNAYFTTGTGSSQPKGVITAASVGKTGTTGQTLTVIVDDLIDLVHSVDPAYRALGNCAFMMNDASLKVIRKLKDSAGRPIFIPGYDGLAGKMQDTLLGYPVIINQDVAVMAANAKSIAFGDFSFYTIRDAMAAELFRFTDSAYTKLGQVGFLQWSRHGGTLLDTAAVKLYQNSAT